MWVYRATRKRIELQRRLVWVLAAVGGLWPSLSLFPSLGRREREGQRMTRPAQNIWAFCLLIKKKKKKEKRKYLAMGKKVTRTVTLDLGLQPLGCTPNGPAFMDYAK